MKLVDEAPSVIGAAPEDLNSEQQVVDPAVSRAKFDAEIRAYRAIEKDQVRLGWWLLEADFPKVFVVFAAPQLKPPAVICGVQLDFTNYDLEPPSVRLVDPFTRVPYRSNQLPTVMLRRQIKSIPALQAAGLAGAQATTDVPLLQAHHPDDIPFLCVPGVLEYHRHPAHTGDSWLTHRGLGAGTLINLLSVIYQYGVRPIASYGIGLQVVGFHQNEPPQ